ncbi:MULTISPECIES: hypothetical protein [Bacillales]|uniref:hypothetical protein n=1 Tax=Bacillales TaxID=1385 RepID=UPI00190DC83A|nr:hypothetical protein [Staphylococcus aureus]MBK3311796.1 hypothetical protein [Staphylococcus aureus]WAI28711.1 MAG: hypothetical protein NRZ50_10355 [Bacillus paranthracis]WAI33480.1 MAG: hypothetical protein NRZ52_04705 [Bacillus paranthracis]WAI38384.1 MAG: hypothetical protein NRZ51_27925 [Bacillus paranthracis]
MSKKRKDGKIQKTTVKRNIIVETVGELNVELFAETFIKIVRAEMREAKEKEAKEREAE